MQTITWFHKMLAAIWICGLIGLGLGISASHAGTDRFIRSEVGLLRKPMTAASKWLLDKQIKASFGNVEAQAIVVTNPIDDAFQALKFVWEKTWQQAILKAALNLLSAIFKIIEQFINKLLDMITSIGNISSVLSPFVSAVTGAARSGFAKVRACAEYWAVKNLSESFPAADVQNNIRDCPWLDENINSNFETLSTEEEFNRKESQLVAKLSSDTVAPATRNDLVDSFVNAKAESQSITKDVKLGCTSGDAMWQSLTGKTDCPSLVYNQINEEGKKQDLKAELNTQIADTGAKAQEAVQNQVISGGAGDDNLALLPKSATDTLSKDKKKTAPKVWPKEFCSRIDPRNPELYCPVSLDKINATQTQIDLANLQSTKTPQTSGGVQEAFSQITNEFAKMLTDMLTKLVETTVLRVFDFITDKIMTGINAFLGQDSILGSLGLDTVAGEAVGSLRDGIRDIARGDIKDVDGDKKRNETGDLDCSKVYWLDEAENYKLAQSRSDCTSVGMRFESTNWCRTWNNSDEFAELIQRVSRVATPADSNGQNLIERTCRQRGLGQFELRVQ